MPSRRILILTVAILTGIAGHASAAPIRTFTITAYCQQGITKSGAPTRTGVAAADPGVLPLGSVVDVKGPRPASAEIYTVLDTGSKVNGRHLDLFTPNCDRARAFGRRLLRVTILRFGWPRHFPTPSRPF